MKIKLWQVAVVIVLIIFGGIGVTMLTGIWTTEDDKVPTTFTTGEFAGEYNPEDIRGSYTFQQVADAFQIDLSVLFDAFGIPADTDGTVIKTKDIETAYGDAEIGNGSVQLFVGLYKGLPVALIDTWLTPRGAEIILASNPNLTQEQIDYIRTHQVEITATEADTAADALTEEETLADTETHDESDEPTVNGSTSFQNVLDLGLTQAQVEEIIGGPMPAGNMLIRDYCTAQGLSFSEVKAALNDALLAME